jgi:N-acetylneuraminic acid mutarotase
MDPARPPRPRSGPKRPNGSSSRHPSAADYRRRRLIVLVGAVLVVALIAYFANRGSGHKPHTAATGRATTTGPARSSQTTTTVPAPLQLSIAAAPWHLRAPLSRAVALPAGGHIDVLGGLSGAGTATTPAITQYDPATGAAQQVGTLLYPVHDSAGAVIDGQLFVFGGGAATLTSATQSFHPTGGGGTPAVSVAGRLPTPRADLASATGSDGTVYLAGGFDGTQFSPAVLSTRDGATFTTVANLPVPARYAAAAVTGSELLVIGGETGARPTPASEVTTDDIQAVNLQTGQVSLAGHLPAPLAHASAVALNGSVYVFGGRSSSTTVDTVYKLTVGPSGVTAALVGHIPTPLSDMAVVTIGQTAYLIGGEGPGSVPGTSVVVARMVAG